MSVGLAILVMVVAEQVQRAVDDQVRRMVLDGDALVRRFRHAYAARKHDIAKQQFRSGNFCGAQIVSSSIGKERTLVGLSLPRHWH